MNTKQELNESQSDEYVCVAAFSVATLHRKVRLEWRN